MKKGGFFILIIALCVLLTACGEQKAYDEACALFENGRYAEAVEMFRALGSFSDSPDRVKIAETRLEQTSAWRDGDKAEAMLRMFYVCRPKDTDAAIEACYQFMQPLPSPTGATKNLVDWERDFTLMAAPVNRILGTECRSLPYLHWHSFLAAWMEIGPETLYGQILRIREKLKKGRKLEKAEREFLKKNRHLVILPSRYSCTEEALLAEWT